MSTVHFLHFGRAMCGYSNKMPGKWPDGNQWVGLNDVEDHEYVNCILCLSKAKDLGRLKPPSHQGSE